MRPWWLRLTRYAVPQLPPLALLTFLILAEVGLNLLRPWPLKLIVDSVLARQPLPGSWAWVQSLPGGGSTTGLLGLLAFATLLTFLAVWLSRALQSYIQVGIGSRMMYEFGMDVFDHVQRLSLRFHGKRAVGDLALRITKNTTCVRDLILNVYLGALTSLASLIAMFAVMWQLDWMLSLVALSIAPLLGLIIRISTGPLEARSADEIRLQGEAAALAEQTLAALPMVQAHTQEEVEDRRFSSLCRRAGHAYQRNVMLQEWYKVGTNSMIALGTAAVMLIGGLHVVQGTLTLGGLLVFVSYLATLYSPLETLTYLSAGYAAAAASAKRVFEVFDEVDDRLHDAPGARPVRGRARGHISLEGVSFGYEPGRPVLHGIDLEARPGDTVALVGRTGAGKTTLASLIVRFADPWQGRVLLDGKDLREIQLTSLRSQVALVLQDPFLLPLTVADNIAYGRPGASRREIVEAAVAANADDFIGRLPRGYDTILAERGVTLSGGERQRLSIARALLKDAPILLLDEPTSALDTETESSVLAALQRLMQGRTTIVIAHRLSTVRLANQIVVLEGGRIVERGSPKDLLRVGGAFAHLYELQVGVDRVLAGKIAARVS